MAHRESAGIRAGLGSPSVRARNRSNRTIRTGDNLDIVRGMNGGSVDPNYLDPPFNAKANHAAPSVSRTAGAALKDAWNQHVDGPKTGGGHDNGDRQEYN